MERKNEERIMKKTYKVIIRFGSYTDAGFEVHATNKKQAMKIAKDRNWADFDDEKIEETGEYKDIEIHKVLSIKEIKDG
jgi:hypothetical protein